MARVGNHDCLSLSKRRAIYPRTKEHGGKTAMAVVADGIEARPSHPSATNPAENVPLLCFTPTRGGIQRVRNDMDYSVFSAFASV